MNKIIGEDISLDKDFDALVRIIKLLPIDVKGAFGNTRIKRKSSTTCWMQVNGGIRCWYHPSIQCILLAWKLNPTTYTNSKEVSKRIDRLFQVKHYVDQLLQVQRC